jgi:hypothetical protein
MDANIDYPISGSYKRVGNLLTPVTGGRTLTLSITPQNTPNLKKPIGYLIDITDQVNHTGDAVIISGVFKNPYGWYWFDYQGFFYNLYLNEGDAGIIKGKPKTTPNQSHKTNSIVALSTNFVVSGTQKGDGI